MSDVHSKKTRSYNMSRIRGRDTKIELLVRKYLFSKGLRYRKNDKRYKGTPDLIFPKYKTIVFIHGCFWHKHTGCKCYVPPKSNVEFWEDKLNKNKIRDDNNIKILVNEGWNVITVWECELKNTEYEERLNKLYCEIKGLL